MPLSIGPTRRLVVAGAAFLLPRVAMSDPTGPRRIGYLVTGTSASSEISTAAFREGLRTLGYGDQDVAMQIRYADGHVERLPGLAAELVRLAPEVIVAPGATATRAAKAATTTIPIVMGGATNPVGSGLIASLARPGGNITGLSIMQEDTVGKFLELLKAAIPHADRIAILLEPDAPWVPGALQTAREAARTLGVELLPIEVRAPGEIDLAFANMVREKAEGIVVTTHPVFVVARRRIVDLAASLKLPAIYGLRDFPAIGGLMSYGLDSVDVARRAAVYADKILRGAKPADLPVEQPTKVALVINLKAARALGLTVPQSLFARADEVIE
jgi:putative tryptophan/tyrosine transport system substrate-binding protein